MMKMAILGRQEARDSSSSSSSGIDSSEDSHVEDGGDVRRVDLVMRVKEVHVSSERTLKNVDICAVSLQHHSVSDS